MAERRPPGADEPIERALADLAGRLGYPPTPDLAVAVRARLTDRSGRRERRRAAWRWAGATAAAAVLLIGAVIVLSPGARTAVGDRIGLRGGVEISFVPSVTPPPEPNQLPFGERSTLGEARNRATFGVFLPDPTEWGLPDEVYFDTAPPGGRVTLVYRPRAALPEVGDSAVGLLLTEFRGALDQVLMQKNIGPGTVVERVSVRGMTGLWIGGRPHLLIFRGANGQIAEDQSRLAGNTLWWQQDGLIFRLETALDRDGAIRIAEGVACVGCK